MKKNIFKLNFIIQNKYKYFKFIYPFSNKKMVEESKKEIIRNEIPEIYTQKCVPKYSRNILRIEHIIKNAEKFIETEGTIAGWSRTCR